MHGDQSMYIYSHYLSTTNWFKIVPEMTYNVLSGTLSNQSTDRQADSNTESTRKQTPDSRAELISQRRSVTRFKPSDLNC